MERRMAELVKFYAWAIPAFGVTSFPDHTWVTTHDNRSIKHRSVKQGARLYAAA
jgi:hypothetical protein